MRSASLGSVHELKVGHSMRPALSLSTFLSTFLLCSAQPTYFSVPPSDAPALAPRGTYPVGVRTLELVHHGQVDILHFDKATGKAPLYDRPLTVEVWYPAVIPSGQTESTTYRMAMPSGATFPIAGKALRDAPPASSGPFPLVVVSHGYPGSRFFLSYLTENLASKGYVVAAIDHTDSVTGAVRGFASTLLNRSADQLFTLSSLSALAGEPQHFLHNLLDPSRAALVGYSMGGYGALATAGAPYSAHAAAESAVPGGYFDAWTETSKTFGASRPANLKAVVAIAPWGNQPPYKSWDAAGLAQIRLPLLLIAGDQDDVSDYSQGIVPAFEEAVHSDRCLLVYENARHNVGGNPPPAAALETFETRTFFDEPVWRKDRITAINQHFITAFLDLYVKGDESRRSFLFVSPVKSNDGEWPLPPGQPAGAAFSDGNHYWKGFERRWAVGLEMRCESAGERTSESK
jgi:alpha-beta hydrolase superfamily lysophospholipase